VTVSLTEYGATRQRRPTFIFKMKIALFGGSFDPVHLGHLLVAQAAREELGLDRLFFIPAAQSPFKPDSKPISGADRLQLLRLALAGQIWCEIDEQEIHRGGVSYTIDTVRDYVRRFPEAQIFYLIGGDNVAKLPLWREAAELARLAEFVVVTRPGETDAPLPEPFRGRALKGFPLGISSSQIRARIRAGQPIEHLVPAAVAEAIRGGDFYKERMTNDK
jgi:nicotinate-nucleotide adenylyltransferase